MNGIFLSQIHSTNRVQSNSNSHFSESESVETSIGTNGTFAEKEIGIGGGTEMVRIIRNEGSERRVAEPAIHRFESKGA